MYRLVSLALCAALCLEPAAAFAPTTGVSRSATPSALSMSNSENQEKRFAASVLTAAYIFANAVSVAPAFAAPEDSADFGSTQVIAAKSGGRMGGRSATGSRGASYSKTPTYSKSSSSASNTKVIEKTTVIQQPAVVQSPVIVAPPVVAAPMMGYGYAPDPVGLGLSVGLSAVNSIGREMREQSQEREIARERAELADAKMKAAELEGRLRALEARP